MFTHRNLRRLPVAALGAALLVSLAACTPATPGTRPTTDASWTPAPGATGTNLLPPLDGVDAGAFEGWIPGACGDLSFAYPDEWDLSTRASTDGQKVYNNPALVVLTGEGDPGILPAMIRVNCDEEPGLWNGEAAASEELLGQDVAPEDIDAYRLDVSGAEHAAVWVAPETGTGSATNVDPGQRYISAQILAAAPDGRYFTVFITLPTEDASYDVIRGVAASLSID
jgi:hypothetical protein